MGFAAYTGYLENDVGSIKIAVIDDGVSYSSVGCAVSDSSYDFINNQTGRKNYGNSHGTRVANAIADAFGSIADHLTIISYRIENPSNGEISYILMGEAIKRAKEDGAEYANISIAGESAYDNHQENHFLRECISYFGSNRVIAAAGNHVASASNYLPGRYCVTAGAAQLDSSGNLVRANGTATGASYSGYATTTSIAAGKVTAALALTQLGSDDIGTALVDVQDGARMPNLGSLAINLVSEIILNGGDMPSAISLEVGDPLNIQYSVQPSSATDPTVLAVSSNTSVIAERNHDSRYYRFTAKAPGSADITFTSQDGNAAPVVVHVTVRQPVTSITVTGDTGEVLMKGETLPLYATVLPNNASDKTLIWLSSNESIAVVSETGVVTQVGEGIATISAQSRSDPYVTSEPVQIACSNERRGTGVTVYAEGNISMINLKTSVETVQMHATVSPEGSNQAVTWSVDRPDIAEISTDGLLTARKPGIVIVTATSVSSNVSGFVGMTVIQLPTGITITGDSSVDVGYTLQLQATVSPENANDKTVTWSSSNTSVATVSDNGIVTGEGEGIAVVIATCSANPLAVAYQAVSVTLPPQSIQIDDPGTTMLDIGQSLTLTATIGPASTPNKTVTWTSSDSSIAAINPSGVLTVAAPGNVTISASTYNGITDSMEFTVRQPYTLYFDANGGSCDPDSMTAYSGYSVGGPLPTPVRNNRYFQGWYTSASGGSQVTEETVFTSASSVTIYAHWSLAQYRMVFNGNGGTLTYNVAGQSIQLETMNKLCFVETPVGELPVPTRNGYEFDGWYDQSFTMEITPDYAQPEASNITVYAKWTRNTCTITFDANGGSCSTTTETMNQGDSIGTLPTPTRPYYTFQGWYTAASGGTQVETSTTLSTDTTLYAHWELNDFGNWSSWSKTAVTANENREVQTEVRNEQTGTKTTYSYKRYAYHGNYWNVSYGRGYADANNMYGFWQNITLDYPLTQEPKDGYNDRYTGYYMFINEECEDWKQWVWYDQVIGSAPVYSNVTYYRYRDRIV